MQVTFGGRLGKHSESLISRMMSSKMPGGFNITAARRYLENERGFATGRQDGVLLFAINLQPVARLSSESDARTFFDGVVESYTVNTGIVLPVPSLGANENAREDVALGPAAPDLWRKEQQVPFRQMLDTHSRHFNRASEKLRISSRERVDKLQSQLNLWMLEHGEKYALGIKPIFKPAKVRLYDSFWNWALQDVLTVFYGIIDSRTQIADPELTNQITRIKNRSSPRLLDSIRYLLGTSSKDRKKYEVANEFMRSLLDSCEKALTLPPVAKNSSVFTAPKTTIDPQGKVRYAEIARPNVCKFGLIDHKMTVSSHRDSDETAKVSKMVHRRHSVELWDAPVVHIQKKGRYGWKFSEEMTKQYSDSLNLAASYGTSFHDKHVLLIGTGPASIGTRILQGLLSGGAKIVVSSSTYSPKVTRYYQSIYESYGARDSRLVVVPFNQGSRQDVEALVAYIYDSATGLGWDLDHIIPFAAISENGRDIDNIDSKSELAHRIMLTNTIRLLGAVKRQKSTRGIRTRPAQVILPLSPNHGTFGNDGLYSESKLSLEALFNKWYSESWSDFLSICGAVIGWTRGTGLMIDNDIVSEGIEKAGVRTFSRQEMASNILGLMTPSVVRLCQIEPLLADLAGGADSIPNISDIVSEIRQSIIETSEIRRAIAREQRIEYSIVKGEDVALIDTSVTLDRRANIKLPFPVLPDYKTELKSLSVQLKGMVDFEKVVVIVGFSEVGPYGNSRTRWEMEAYGEFSLEGCIEMAWIMRLIKHHNAPFEGQQYCGWVDAKTGQPIADKDVKSKYEKYILENSGIRLVKSTLENDVDPDKKQFLHEVVIQEDLEPFEVSKETAENFKEEHGNKVEVFEIPESGEYSVYMKKGASLMIPKALRLGCRVAGQIPTGWNARTYGISEEIISQVDPVTLYVLIGTVEALLSAGITDPYELYQYIHVSEVGICIGSGLGGLSSLTKIFKERFLDKPVQSDVLQESFINTPSAWVNMLLLSSVGPIKTPVGACATAIESLDTGYEIIVSGKAKVCLVGGSDDLQEDVSFEFANMKATINADEDSARGRAPEEMSRPATSTRNGFVEAQGCGIQVLTTAKLALDMGLPIYGVVALTETASDKIGRSVPAPGTGLLTVARESPTNFAPPLLDIGYRKRLLELRMKHINQSQGTELEYLQEKVDALRCNDPVIDFSEYKQECKHNIEVESRRLEKEALNTYGNHFWKSDARISPLRGALATWGLTIDDLNVASFHGTSTSMGDKNELEVIHRQLSHLGRRKGNTILGVFQKYLTGHPKGAAGAWMMNGCLQILNSGLVTGNRNADNIDNALEKYHYITFPSRSIQTDGVKAFSITSFGFGQKGAQAIGVHAKYLFATLEEDIYRTYQAKAEARQKRAHSYFHNALTTNSMFVAKDRPPYRYEQEFAVLVDPDARGDNTSCNVQSHPNIEGKQGYVPNEMTAGSHG